MYIYIYIYTRLFRVGYLVVGAIGMLGSILLPIVNKLNKKDTTDKNKDSDNDDYDDDNE